MFTFLELQELRDKESLESFEIILQRMTGNYINGKSSAWLQVGYLAEFE